MRSYTEKPVEQEKVEMMLVPAWQLHWPQQRISGKRRIFPIINGWRKNHNTRKKVIKTPFQSFQDIRNGVQTLILEQFMKFNGIHKLIIWIISYISSKPI